MNQMRMASIWNLLQPWFFPSLVEDSAREMLGEVGWVAGLPGQAIKIAHQKVFRTLVPKYPRPRFRTTWLVMAGRRVCVEDPAEPQG